MITIRRDSKTNRWAVDKEVGPQMTASIISDLIETIEAVDADDIIALRNAKAALAWLALNLERRKE